MARIFKETVLEQEYTEQDTEFPSKIIRNPNEWTLIDSDGKLRDTDQFRQDLAERNFIELERMSNEEIFKSRMANFKDVK